MSEHNHHKSSNRERSKSIEKEFCPYCNQLVETHIELCRNRAVGR